MPYIYRTFAPRHLLLARLTLTLGVELMSGGFHFLTGKSGQVKCLHDHFLMAWMEPFSRN